MNLPNKLTIFRVIIIPFMVVIYYLNPIDQRMVFNGYNITIFGLFILASLTDYLDGYLARKHDLITVFGKFLDPLADKLLVMFALLMLQDIGIIPMWIVLVILSREFIVTGIRLVAASEGTVIAAGNLGKYKTAFTMVALIVLLVLPEQGTVLYWIGIITLYIGVLLTVVSGVEYFMKNRAQVFKSK